MAIREIYPKHIDNALYSNALKQCIMDLWFEIDGYTLKVPAGQRSSLTGWDTLALEMETLRSEFYGRASVYRGGFQFVSSVDLYIHDALVVFSPDGSRCGGYFSHHRTLEECIALINRHKLEKVVIIGSDLTFLSRCPSIKWITTHYSYDATSGMDFLHCIRCRKS